MDDMDDDIKAAGKTAGFARVLTARWDFKSPLVIDTVRLSGGLGTNGLLVVSFTATGAEDGRFASIQAVGYPGSHNTTAKRTMAISTKPAVLYEKAPLVMAAGATATLYYCMGKPPFPYTAQLTPGVRYYINVAMRSGVSAVSPQGRETCIAKAANYPRCEMRLTIQALRG